MREGKVTHTFPFKDICSAGHTLAGSQIPICLKLNISVHCFTTLQQWTKCSAGLQFLSTSCFQKRCLSLLLEAGRRKTNRASSQILFCHASPMKGHCLATYIHTHTSVILNKFRDQLRLGATYSSPTNLQVIQSLDSSYAPLHYFFQMLKCFSEPLLCTTWITSNTNTWL